MKTKSSEILLDVTDGLLSISEALSKRLPSVPSAVTCWRWRTRGANGVKLPAVRCGREWMTTLPAVDEFMRRQSEVS